MGLPVTARSRSRLTSRRISAYLDAREDDEIDLQLLKHDRLIAIRASDGAPAKDWPIRSCLVYQVELEDGLYVLSTGDWFRVENDYRKRVEAEVESYPASRACPMPTLAPMRTTTT